MQGLFAQIFKNHRLVLFFALPNIVTMLSIPELMPDVKLQLPVLGSVAVDRKKMRLIAYGIILALTCYFWYYQYVKANSSETYPYIFGV